MSTLYNEFIATFKVELPFVGGEINLYNEIKYNIMERLGVGDIQPTNINGLFCLDGVSLIYYWFEENGQMTHCIELTKKPYAMLINGIGYLNDKSKIGDLYEQILKINWNGVNFKNNKKPVPCLIFSNNQLTNDNIKMWDKLIKNKNYLIYAYEIKQNIMKMHKKFKTGEEFCNCHISNMDEKWQYFIADLDYGLLIRMHMVRWDGV
jgi:hypothetical protein